MSKIQGITRFKVKTITLKIRTWLSANLVDLKKANPVSKIYIRECENVEPYILARYGNLLT
jgi:hypothetical protein